MDTTAAADIAPAQRCRAVLTSGLQCLSRALEGEDCCYEHADHWFPTWPAEGEEVHIPLLEDEAAVRYLLTMVAHGIATKRLDSVSARNITYACQVARSTFPRRAARPAKEAEEKPYIPEPVVALERSAAGRPMGERQRYVGPTGAFEPQWSFAKYMFEKECERYKRPLPTCAADMPPSGWLTEQEATEPFEQFNARYNARNDRLRDEAQAWDLAHPEEARVLAEERARQRAQRDARPGDTEQQEQTSTQAADPPQPESPANIDLHASASGSTRQAEGARRRGRGRDKGRDKGRGVPSTRNPELTTVHRQLGT